MSAVHKSSIIQHIDLRVRFSHVFYDLIIGGYAQAIKQPRLSDDAGA
jgi:hypothetical protein